MTGTFAPSDNAMLRGVNLYLIGMMGSGKSSVGRILAERLDYQFFDSDQLIEQVSKTSIAEIFAQEGEESFRTVETQVLAQLAPYPRLVISTGGGAVLKSENWSYLHHGIVVWLDVPPETLFARVSQDPTPRPLLQQADPLQTLKAIFQERQRYYAQADIRVDADAPAEEVVQRTLDSLKARIEQDAPNRAKFYGS
jgi:shikimate kinase